MTGYTTDLEQTTTTNEDFRHVLYTGEHAQLVAMTLRPGEDIGLETHPTIDQFIRVEAGMAEAVLDGEEHRLGDGDVVIVPAGVEHDVRNVSDDLPLRLSTIYSPPAHPDGTVQPTKQAEAQ